MLDRAQGSRLLGAAIALLRDKADLSRDTMARVIGKSEATLRYIESGEYPVSADTLSAIENATGLYLSNVDHYVSPPRGHNGRWCAPLDPFLPICVRRDGDGESLGFVILDKETRLVRTVFGHRSAMIGGPRVAEGAT
jgi:transcriptional regulator with XRE-family HTH domain